MNRRSGRGARPWFLLLALLVALAVWAALIAAALRPGGISSFFGGQQPVKPAAVAPPRDRDAHVTKHSSGSVPPHAPASGQGKGSSPAERRDHKGSPKKPSDARPLGAVIRISRALLEIPELGVRAPLVPTGAEGAPGKASLIVPDDIHTVAWWDGTVLDGDQTAHEDAPSPGQPGVAVIAGHIDSASAGPGALYDLKDLSVGDTVKIIDSLGHTSSWTVSAPPETSLKTALPPALWVSTGPPRLAIVTCGGPFDTATGHYLDNVIVWARPSSASPGRRSPRH
jgi:Sortase domain